MFANRLRRPPFAESIGRWRSAMTIEEIASCKRVAGESLSELGYRAG
jgi:hypothetical protein